MPQAPTIDTTHIVFRNPTSDLIAKKDPDHLLAPLQAASCSYRIAFGPQGGAEC